MVTGEFPKYRIFYKHIPSCKNNIYFLKDRYREVKSRSDHSTEECFFSVVGLGWPGPGLNIEKQDTAQGSYFAGLVGMIFKTQITQIQISRILTLRQVCFTNTHLALWSTMVTALLFEEDACRHVWRTWRVQGIYSSFSTELQPKSDLLKGSITRIFVI